MPLRFQVTTVLFARSRCVPPRGVEDCVMASADEDFRKIAGVPHLVVAVPSDINVVAVAERVLDLDGMGDVRGRLPTR